MASAAPRPERHADRPWWQRLLPPARPKTPRPPLFDESIYFAPF